LRGISLHLFKRAAKKFEEVRQMRKGFCAFLVMLLTVFLTVSSEAASPNVYIATQAVGSSYYAVATGVAKIITENTPYRASVLPYSGADAWMVEVKDGAVNSGIIAAMDLVWAYTGTVNYDEKYDELRLLLSGNWSSHCTMTVLESSGITSIQQLKGKRVGYEYGGNKLTVLLVDAALEIAGMSIQDCVTVPVADLNTALRALQERRVDAVFSGSNSAPASMQLDEAVGIRVLPIGDFSPEDIANGVPERVQAIYNRLVPGATAKVCPPGGTVKVPTVLTAYPIQMAISTSLNDDDAYTILKAIYDHHSELASSHVWGQEWVPANYVVEGFQVPYHEGAVKFYKEVGLWTESAEATQQALLKK
jgi:TRAP transporter TAXI family solute receptor